MQRLSFELLQTIFTVGINQSIKDGASFKSQLLIAEMFDALWADLNVLSPTTVEVRLLISDNIEEYTHMLKFGMGDEETDQYHLVTIHAGFLSYEIYRKVDLDVSSRLVPLKKSHIDASREDKERLKLEGI